MPQSHLDALLELAAENEGLVTTRSAAEAGISRRTLAGMVERGRLERLSRGVYRLVHSNRDALSPYREAILWAQSHRGPRVALSHETALAVLGLTDANPSTIQLTVPPHARLRRSAPARIAIHRAILDSNDVIEYEGLPVTSVPRTVLDLARNGNFRFAADAVVQARREGFITEIQSRQNRGQLIPQIGVLAARSLAAAAAVQERENLRAAIAREREELRAALRHESAVSWREFVTERALAGDEAAISALRGLRYQDGRERRRSERNGFSSPTERTDPWPRVFEGLGYQIQRSGAVAFYRAGDSLRRDIFRDEGWFIAVREPGEAEMKAAMRLAAEKWGRSITIAGSREFKERSLAIAIDLGIQVCNRELQSQQQLLRANRETTFQVYRVGSVERSRDGRER